ncbi:MAG: NTP transferase domain-containing protein [bacterium]
MMRAVILAAGDGGRLGEHTADLPKPLVRVGGRPLIAYAMEALVSAGIEEIVVVVGYRAEQTRAGVEAVRHAKTRVRFVTNHRFEAGASLSLWAARAECGDEPFLLLMADHLISASIVRKLTSEERARGTSLVATDASTWPEAYNGEATRVRFAEGTRRVEAIAKNIEPWDALDTGAFLLDPAVWDAMDVVPEDCELSVIFQELARRGQLMGVDVSGASWYDVDTAEDLEAAQRVVAGGAR